ncbi:MAG: hypothetical protein ACD_56C00030G0003 [uncultured bacterium]|nr:MAG: hypothetical protein ACD_56C00030G0003 [uncultured bacterium]
MKEALSAIDYYQGLLGDKGGEEFMDRTFHCVRGAQSIEEAREIRCPHICKNICLTCCGGNGIEDCTDPKICPKICVSNHVRTSLLGQCRMQDV